MLVMTLGGVYGLTFVNTIYVTYTGANLGLRELAYLGDLFILYDSVRAELQNSARWLACSLAAFAALMGLCGYIVGELARLVRGGAKRSSFLLILGVISITAALRSLSLHFRTVLYEPVGTHILPYLAWRGQVDREHHLKAPPSEGLASLAAYRQELQQVNAGSLPVHLAQGTNVVLIVLESFGAGPLRAHPGLAPFVEELSRTAGTLTLDAHYTNVYRTIGAQYSILCSSFDPLAFYVIRDYPLAPARCSPEVLGESGYATLWISGAKPEFDYNGEWLSRHGVSSLHSADDFAASGPRFSYGVHDEALFERLTPLLAASREPFFAYVLTVSNHHPYEFPESFDTDDAEASSLSPLERGYRYTDRHLARFFAAARKEPWFEHTLFVLVGDHAPWGYQSALAPSERHYASYRDQYQTLALLHHPALNDLAAITHDTSHVDLAATVVALLGLPDEATFLGRPVFHPPVASFVGSQDNQRGSFYQIHNRERVVRASADGSLCEVHAAANISRARPCDAAERLKLGQFRSTFYDTQQWWLTKG